MTPKPLRAERPLELALLFTIVAHAAAMAGMALLLLPGMPGSEMNDSSRIQYVAGHPWLWRLGWFPWQITALSDLALAAALLRSRFIPRLPAILSLLATVAAVVIEQPGEFLWITKGVELAREALRQNMPGVYLQFETATFLRVGAWAATAYTVAAVFWSWCFAAAGTWNRFLTWLSAVLWMLLFAVSIGPLLPEAYRMNATLVAAGNALGFLLLMVWLCLVTELVLRRSRPDGEHGRMRPWRHPRRNILARAMNCVANSRLARAYGEWAPTVAFASDITNVIYVNYLLEAAIVEPLVPWGLELQRLGPGGKYALFTFLTYNHGNFGPRLLGPLRRLLPSPVQSNWRIHVQDPRTRIPGIYFVSTAIGAALPAIAARLFAEGMPMHLPAHSSVSGTADGTYRVLLDPAEGSSPDVDATLVASAPPELTGRWLECFTSYREMLAYCVPQDRAMSSQPWYRRVTRQEIRLGIPLDACEPVSGTVISRAAQQLAGNSQPLCFRVARVSFQFDRELHSMVD